MKCLRYILIAITAICFMVLLLVAWIVMLVLMPLVPFAHKGGYVRNLAEAQDRVIAALAGRSGKWTVSVEVALHKDGFAGYFYRFLNLMVNRHCERSVEAEHPYCRIADRKDGEK